MTTTFDTLSKELTDPSKAEEALVAIINHCTERNLSFTRILELAIERSGNKAIKSNPNATNLFKLEGEHIESGEPWQPYADKIYTTKELAEYQMQREIIAYTYKGKCEYEFKIKEITIK
jgi:hypothetical protein